jgi:two-component system response regulator MprA
MKPHRAARVLVVEDDRRTAAFLDRALTRHGYEVSIAHDGPAALVMARAQQPDLVVLDRMLPGLDGLEVSRALRQNGPTPILMLTARDAIGDRVMGLDAGADDYLVKPFAVEELLARVRAQLRRRQIDDTSARQGVITYADLRVNQDSRQAYRNNRRVRLRPTTFDLLAYFVRNAERVLSRQELLENVWGYEHMGGSNLVNVTILDLRRHLEQPGEARLIQTVRRAGYMLAVDSVAAE